MGLGATLSNGVSIDFDDIEISLFEPDENSANVATFDYGSSKEFQDTRTVKFTDELYLPIQQNERAGMRAGTNKQGENWSTRHGQISNHSGWYCSSNNKYYEFGEKVSVDEVGKNPKFIAVYEGGTVDFDNLSNDFKFYVSNETSYGYMSGKVMGDSNKYVNLTGGESQKGSRAQVLLFTDKDQFLGYNAGKTYKVTFKYRRTDNNNVDSKLFFSFGAPPWGWRAESGCVSRIEIGLTKKGMTEFETVTDYVTAPDGYEFNTGGNNPEYFYSRTMGLGATLSNGVSIDFDDIEISLFEPKEKDTNLATFDYGSSKEFQDTRTVKFTDVLYLPIQQNPRANMRAGTNSSGVNWSTKHGQISNHSAWYCSSNNTYYELGEKVSVDEVGKNPKFIAVYEDGLVDFNNISSDFEFYVNNKTSYGYANAKVMGDSNKYVNLTGGEAQKNTNAQVLLFTDEDQFLGYNTGKTYKVTFKYRRTDNNDVDSKLFFSFGAIPWGWRAASGCVTRIEIGPTKKGMTEFETVTRYFTAPDGYEFNTGGKSPEYFYSRTMGLGAALSNGVSIDFDDTGNIFPP